MQGHGQAPLVFPADSPWTLSAQRAGPGLFLDQGGGVRSELRVGEIVPVRGGFVRIEKLGMWMGYRVFYEPHMSWLFATALLALAALAVLPVTREPRKVRHDRVATAGELIEERRLTDVWAADNGDGGSGRHTYTNAEGPGIARGQSRILRRKEACRKRLIETDEIRLIG